jgi:ABC-type sugar transport system permease subunit
MVIFITGMTSISQDVLEAAQIDGANRWVTVWHIITPLMKPVIKVSLVLITTSSLKVFDSVFVLTGGGPVHATEVMPPTCTTSRSSSCATATVGHRLFAVRPVRRLLLDHIQNPSGQGTGVVVMQSRKQENRAQASRIARYAFLCLYGVVIVYPAPVHADVVLQDQRGDLGTPWSLPQSFSLTFYVRLFTEFNMHTYFLNSLFYAVVVCLAGLAITTTAAYAIGRMKWKLSKPVLGLLMTGPDGAHARDPRAALPS